MIYTFENVEIYENIILQLVNIYNEHEWWHKEKMSYEDAYKYHAHQFKNGNIFVYMKDEKVVGYCEYWRCDFRQWGRIVCHAPFSPLEENVTRGDVCVVANVWIDENYRKSEVVKSMEKEFFKRNCSAEYFVGQAERKSANLIKVFKRENLSSSLFTKGVKNG